MLRSLSQTSRSILSTPFLASSVSKLCRNQEVPSRAENLVQEENETLQQMVLDMAGNKTEANEKVANLREHYNDLVHEVWLCNSQY